MQYLYYPGCSARNGYSYEIPQTVFKRLGARSRNPDWNCCITAGYVLTNKTYALAGIWRSQNDNSRVQAMKFISFAPVTPVPDSGKPTTASEDPVNGPRIKRALRKLLIYTHKIVIRHPLDIILNDIGLMLSGAGYALKKPHRLLLRLPDGRPPPRMMINTIPRVWKTLWMY